MIKNIVTSPGFVMGQLIDLLDVEKIEKIGNARATFVAKIIKNNKRKVKHTSTQYGSWGYTSCSKVYCLPGRD